MSKCSAALKVKVPPHTEAGISKDMWSCYHFALQKNKDALL